MISSGIQHYGISHLLLVLLKIFCKGNSLGSIDKTTIRRGFFQVELEKIVTETQAVRALPNITSGPEVQQIFRICTVQKLDVFRPGRGLLTLLKIKKKTIFRKNFFFKTFFYYYIFSNTSRIRSFDTKFLSRDLII